MKDYLQRITEAAENGNLEELGKLSKTFLYGTFAQSMFEQLTTTAYFPNLNPEFSSEFDNSKTSEEAHKKALERVKNDPYLLITASFDEEAIKEITDYDFISLFEVALLIGYRVEKDPRLLAFECDALFFDAIIKKQINPREPNSKSTYRELHESPIVIDGEVVFTKDSPDLSWQLTLKEAAEFAILKGYPEYLFTDLLNDTEKPNNEDYEPSRPANEEQNSNQESPVSLSENPDWKTKNEREFLLRTVGALTLLLIEKTQTEKFGNRQKPNKKAIYEAIYQLLYDMEFKTEGQTKTTLNDAIKEALEVTMR